MKNSYQRNHTKGRPTGGATLAVAAVAVLSIATPAKAAIVDGLTEYCLLYTSDAADE